MFGACFGLDLTGLSELASFASEHGCNDVTRDQPPTTAVMLESGVTEIIAAAQANRQNGPSGTASNSKGEVMQDNHLSDEQQKATIDLYVRHAACTEYTDFPIMYWALVPVWTAITFTWVALSFQIHSAFATTIHSVMTVVPVLKLMDVLISAYLWMDCVDSGSFSIPAVLAWVAIRSLYQPFFMLMFLLLAHGWCILCREMSRAASMRISAVVSTLYICLALNFLYAGNYWSVRFLVSFARICFKPRLSSENVAMPLLKPELNNTGGW
eukprot:SAG31_NODE_1546_length_7927_cov_29.239525_5_plen_269_part_00